MPEFGVRPEGFVPKAFDTILNESMSRARAVLGADVDLSPTSPLRKLLEVTASEDALLWRRLEELFYSGFLSCATGAELDLLGEEIGVQRRNLFSQGTVRITINQPQSEHVYNVPEGTVLLTADPPGLVFHTTAPLRLSTELPSATVRAQAFTPGSTGDVPAGAIIAIDPVYQQLYVPVPAPATLTVTNEQQFSGGADQEPDEEYRAELLGWPRTIWTPQSLRAAALAVPGVIDVLLADPLGGVDVSQSYFNLFQFGQRRFTGERTLGEPYFVSLVVAHDFARPWRTTGPVTGVYEQVVAALERVRPVGVYPSVIEADHIAVGVRARVIAHAGDAQALRTALIERVAAELSSAELGGDALYSQVIRALLDPPGVIDVQEAHLRRCPPAFGRITFGSVPFQTEVLEAGPGENLTMGPAEIAVFRADSVLLDLEVTQR